MAIQEHPLSWQALGRILIVTLILLFVWKTFNILVLIIIAAMFASALFPIVKILNKKLPLVISTLLVILLLIVPFVILGATVIPSFIKESPQLLETITKTINTSPLLPSSVKTFDFTQYAENAGGYVLQSTAIITNIVTSTLTLLFLTFYLIYDSKRLIALVLSIFPKNKQQKVSDLLSELGKVNGQYIRGNLFISLICGVVSYIGLTILQVPFAAPLAIFAALMDLLPLIGSTIAMIPALIIAFTISPLTAILVAALYLIYQQIESTFLAPAIYNKTLNVSPALGFLAVIIGTALFGIIGAFLSLPIAASIPAIIRYIKEDIKNSPEDEKATEKQLKKYRTPSK